MGEAARQITPNNTLPPKMAERMWKPGQSGNPGGRPLSLMHLAREKTDDGVKLIDFALNVLTGQITGAKVSDKIECMKFLADRGWGKPIQPIVTKDEDPATKRDYSKLTDEEFKLYADLWSKLHIQMPGA